MYFRDLIISMAGREISSKLVQAVIGIYLGDNAKTDAISHRLREVSVHFLWVYYANNATKRNFTNHSFIWEHMEVLKSHILSGTGLAWYFVHWILLHTSYGVRLERSNVRMIFQWLGI